MLRVNHVRFIRCQLPDVGSVVVDGPDNLAVAYVSGVKQISIGHPGQPVDALVSWRRALKHASRLLRITVRRNRKVRIEMALNDGQLAVIRNTHHGLQENIQVSADDPSFAARLRDQPDVTKSFSGALSG